MHDDSKKMSDALIYITNTVKAGAVTLVLGILFTPLIYLLANRSSIVWFYLILLIGVSSLLGGKDANWRFSLLKKHFKEYEEIGSFWIEKRYEVFVPGNILKFFNYGLKSCFVFGEWKYILLSMVIYLFLVIAPIILGVIHLKSNLEIIFIILLLYEIMSFHLFFVFLYWKYKVSKKIKEEYGLDYKDLVSID